MKSAFATRVSVLLALLPLVACASGKKHMQLYDGERHLDLLPGGYDVAVYYEEVWTLDINNEEVVRSKSRLVSLELEAGHSYCFGHRRSIDFDDARILARDLEVTVVDLSGGQPVQLAVESRPAVVSTLVVVSPIPPLEGDAAAAAEAAGGESDAGATPAVTGVPAAKGSQALSALELLKF